MRLPYSPGQKTKLGWARENYTKARWQKFEILNDLAYAACYGFLKCRMPTPGKFLDPEEAEKRAKRVEEAWKSEADSRSRKKEKGLPVSEFPLETKLYLLERIKNIPPPRPVKRGRIFPPEEVRRMQINIRYLPGGNDHQNQ